MTMHYSAAARTAALAAMVALVDAGAAAGTIKIYTGAQPANAAAAATGTLLATFTCADPAFDSITGGVATLDTSPVLTTTAVADGTAGYARVADSDGVTTFDGSVGTSGADYIINTTSISTGQTITLSAGTLTMPA